MEGLKLEGLKAERLKAEGELAALREQIRVTQGERGLAREAGGAVSGKLKAEEAISVQRSVISSQAPAISAGGGAEAAVSGKLKAVSDGGGAGTGAQAEAAGCIRESDTGAAGQECLQETSREGTEGGGLMAEKKKLGKEERRNELVGSLAPGAEEEEGGTGPAAVVETEEEANARRDRVLDEIRRRRAAGLSTAGVGLSGGDEAEVVFVNRW